MPFKFHEALFSFENMNDIVFVKLVWQENATNKNMSSSNIFLRATTKNEFKSFNAATTITTTATTTITTTTTTTTTTERPCSLVFHTSFPWRRSVKNGVVVVVVVVIVTEDVASDESPARLRTALATVFSSSLLTALLSSQAASRSSQALTYISWNIHETKRPQGQEGKTQDWRSSEQMRFVELLTYMSLNCLQNGI